MTATVLIVEDNPQNMKLTRIVLEAEGYTVVGAPDAEQALAAIALELPDICLLDIGLPTMDGLTLARIIRNDARTAALPLVAVTAFAMKGDRERAASAGFDAYVTKPIDQAVLLEAVRSSLELRRPSPEKPHAPGT